MFIILIESESLNLKQLHISIIPDWWIDVPQIDDSPHVGTEPQGCPWICLILAYEQRMRNWKQTHQSTMLQELKNLILICDATINTNFLYLWH